MMPSKIIIAIVKNKGSAFLSILIVGLLLLQSSCNLKHGSKNSKESSRNNSNIHKDNNHRNNPPILINVKSQRVVGDGQTDDTEALLQITKNLRTGDTLYFPKGIYVISEPLLIDQDYITVKGDGVESILQFSNKNDLYAQYKSRVGILNITGNHTTVKKLKFDQNFRNSNRKDGDRPMVGCLLVGGKYLGKPVKTLDLTVEDCEFYDHYGDAVSVFQAKISDAVIKNNHFISSFTAGGWKTAGVKGEQAISFTTGSNILIENNLIEGALDDAIALHRNLFNVSVLNNTIFSCGGRILVNGIDGGLIKGNTITYVEDGSTAILVSFDRRANKLSINKNVVIEENNILIKKGVKVRYGIRLHGPGENIVFRNNNLETEDARGTAVEISGRMHNKSGEMYFGDKIIVEGNQFKNFKVGIFQGKSSAKSRSQAVVRSSDLESAEEAVKIRSNKMINVKEAFSTKKIAVEKPDRDEGL